MINPVLSNFRIEMGDSFFPDIIKQKYNNFLRYKNTPFKTMESYFYETIQNFDIPGFNLNLLTVAGLNNSGRNKSNINEISPLTNIHYPGTTPLNEVIDGITLNVTFRNSILNWMYCYEILFNYFRRSRKVEDFYILVTMMDSAEIPMIRFKLSKCFISTLPGLAFAFNSTFNESKTFDCGFTFSEFSVEFLIPEFNLEEIILKTPLETES